MFRSGGAQPLALLLLLAGMTERVFAAAAAASSKGGPSPPGGWGDHKFTKQGASVNEIYNKLVPFFTQKTDATGEYPPGMVLLFGCAAWIGFMFLMGAWVWFCPHNPFTMMMGGDGGGPERPRAAAKWRKPIKNH